MIGVTANIDWNKVLKVKPTFQPENLVAFMMMSLGQILLRLEHLLQRFIYPTAIS